MVATADNEKAASSNATIEVEEAAENGLAETQSDLLTVDVVKPNEDTQLDDGVGLVTGEARNENLGELLGKGKEVPDVDNEDPSMTEFEEKTSADDEIDDQEDMLFDGEEEHFEHNNEDQVLDDYDVSEEEASEEDDEDAEVSGEEATEDDDVSGEEAINKENDEADKQHEKENTKQVTREAEANDGGEVKEHDIEKSESRSNKIKKSNGRTTKNKVQASRLKKVDSQDKPESSHQRKVKRRVESMGMIFMCSSETKKDCHKYKVLGLPKNKKNIVEKIYTGMRLFLYDVNLKLMYGIYKAAGPGGYNIEPKAFKQQFPSQVRFKVMENCLPLAEEKFKAVIKANYFTRSKFDCKLNSEQVKKLCRLFTASSKGSRSERSGRSLESAKQPIRQERNDRQKTGDKRRLPLREDARRHECPRKRHRKDITHAAVPRKRLPASLPHAHGQERHSPYRDRPLIPLDPCGGVGVPPIERNEHYRDGRDSHLEHRYLHRGDRHDPYRDGRDPGPYADGRAPYLERRDPYIERREFYRDGGDPYTERRDSYRDGRASYLEHRVLYGESAHSELYRRHPISGNGDVYGEGRGIEFRDSYRRDELWNSVLHPLDAETRNHHVYLGRSSLYPSAYPTRSHLHRL